ncbi:hypothetical protein SVIOM74S_06399 [Streptomyces violarus]
MTYRVSPVTTPRASERQYGANRPENAGTMYAPPLSSTLAARVLDLVGGTDDAELVAEPLDQRARYGYRPLQAVDRRLTPDLVPHGRQQTALRGHRAVAGVEQQEASRAVRVLRRADVVAGLAEHGCLLVAQRGGDGYAGELAEGGAVHLAEESGTSSSPHPGSATPHGAGTGAGVASAPRRVSYPGMPARPSTQLAPCNPFATFFSGARQAAACR